MLKTGTKDSPWECDSCKNHPTKTLPDHKKLVMVDIDLDDLEIKQYYLCKDCAESLHNQLGDILGHTPEEQSSLAYIEKIIAESDLIEVTLPNGTTLRATKFGEDKTI